MKKTYYYINIMIKKNNHHQTDVTNFKSYLTYKKKKIVIENAQKLSNLRNVNINPAFCISLFLLTCGLVDEFLYIYGQLCQSS